MSVFPSTALHRAERETTMKTMAIITSAAAGAVLLALGTGGTTLAFWAAGAPLSAGPISTGSLELKVDGHETEFDLTSSLFQGMLPGDRRIQEVAVATTGNVTTELTIANIEAAGSHEIRVALNACPGTALGGSGLGAVPVLLGDWAPVDSKTVCVEVTLPINAPQPAPGATTDFELTFLATQKVN